MALLPFFISCATMFRFPLHHPALALIMLAASLPALALDRYVVDTEHTFSSFEYKHWGLSMQRGRFDKNTGSIELDTDNKSGSLQIIIDADSINTGSDTFNKVLRSDGFLTCKNILRYFSNPAN